MIHFFVPGHPKTAGSKRAFPTKSGKIAVVDACAKSKDWKADVAWAARKAYDGPLLEGPLKLRIGFNMPRPQKHYLQRKSGRTLRISAPEWHSIRPDIDKLSRAIMDALTGVIWHDDGQISSKRQDKFYGKTPGVEVWVEEL